MKINIIKFNIFLFFIEFISSQINQIEDEYFYVKNFYLEIMNSKFYSKIQQNSVSNKFINLLPLENQPTQIDNEKFTILLSFNINIDKSIKTVNLNKGNIYYDGSYLIIYYGTSRIIQNESFVYIGNIEKIDLFIETITNNQISIINIKLSCENSFFENDIKNISQLNPSLILFNKYSLNFNSVPNLYFGDNEPLYKNCNINEDKKYEIICSFSEDEIKRNFFLYKDPVEIFEIIPGWNHPIKSKIFIKFDYNNIIKNCKKLSDDNYKCKKCKNKNYKVSNNGDKCVYSSYFYYICIGVPIINIFPFIIILICILSGVLKGENKWIAIITVSIIDAIFDVLSFIPLY